MEDELVVKEGDGQQDDLAGLTPELIEPAPRTSQPDKIKVGEEEVPLDYVIKAYQNKSEWQKSNTQKAQEIAEERRRLTDEQRVISEREANLRALEQGIYQQAPAYQTQTPQYQPPPDNFEIDDPVTKQLFQTVKGVGEKFNQFQEQYQRDQFFAETQREHSRLKSQFPDYEPTQVERSIIQGRRPYEDVYKATKYDQIMRGDVETITKLVPAQLKEQMRAEVRKEILDELLKREQARKALGTSPPTKAVPGRLPQAKPKDKWEMKERLLAEISEEGLSLTE